jgi:arsenite methyltransferase
MTDQTRDDIRRRYASAATRTATNHTAAANDDRFGLAQYDHVTELPEAARLASLGRGNPLAVADLRHGDVVLDLGSGGGLDVLLSAGRVGPDGFAYGLDMTHRRSSTLPAATPQKPAPSTSRSSKEPSKHIPLPDSTIDVIISNCVTNLSNSKAAVFAEMRRVLRPGGRIGISDILTDDHLTIAERIERGSALGSTVGALSMSEYRTELRTAGFDDIEIFTTQVLGDGVHAATIRAHAPSDRDRMGIRTWTMIASDWPQVRDIYAAGIAAGNATFETGDERRADEPERASLTGRIGAGEFPQHRRACTDR